MIQLAKVSKILITRNIREFEKPLLAVADKLFVIGKSVRYTAHASPDITIVKEPKTKKWRFYANLIRDESIPLIYVQSIHDLLFFGVLKKVKRLKCKIVVVSHSPYTWLTFRSSMLALLVARMLSNGLIFISLREYCRFSRICDRIGLRNFYVPNSIDENRFPFGKTYPKKTGTLVLGSISTIEPRKNQIFLVYLLKRLVDSGVDCQIEIIGDSKNDKYMANVLAKAKELGVSERFRLSGKIAYDDIPNALLRFDIFVFPSVSEMYPFSIAEGMFAGLPIVAFDCNGICDEVKDGYNGFLVPLNISEEQQLRIWTDRIQRLMHDGAMATFGKNSRELALSCNSSSILSLRLNDVLHSIMA